MAGNTIARDESSVSHESKNTPMAEIASKRLDTGLPDSVEVALFVDAIEKVEKALADAIPAKVFALIVDAQQGLDGDTANLVSRLTEKVNKEVDIPMLDEEQEAELLRLLIKMLIDSMVQGNDLETVLAKS